MRLYTTEDMRHQKFAGFGGTYFYIYLNREVEAGSILTYDKDFGAKIKILSNEGLKHKVQTYKVSGYFPEYGLQKDIEYIKL